MYTATYYGVLTEGTNSLIGALFFGRKFMGLCNEGNPTAFHWDIVEVIRTKSNGNITILGPSHDVLIPTEISDITVPRLQGHLGSEDLQSKPFEEN